MATPAGWPRLSLVVEEAGDDVFRHADHRGQRHGRRLVAHVGAVREVVASVHPAEQLVHAAGFERNASGGVEHDRFDFHKVIVYLSQLNDYLMEET
jgi:hypothetical protein